ncbi:H-NS histone family protein [Maribius pontilimi]|uniref:H-NS histone family protein n=1 Tax=Palleronia pontilimi TaxID=1964209 RepID=A0A934IJS9_9RHOB|nr:H-NS histone family protein [Palleronia pontilimi]MBJ3764590.1 H-NS histone family protein [Palleronia pontilimi]
MVNIDLSKLSLDELKKLQRDVTKAIGTYETRQRQNALAAVEAKAKEMGFSLSELTGKQKPSKTISPPKYRHPENPSVTWSGRGRQPAWIKEWLEAGKPLEDFLISK